MNYLLRILIIPMLLFAAPVNAQSREQLQDRAELYRSVEDASEVKPGENIDEKIKKNFFLRAEVSKQTCYVGEVIMATFKAYSRLDANSQVVKRPSLSGFSVIEMVDAYNNEPDVENYNGENYYVHLIRKVQLFPLQEGTFTLEPAEVESVIHLRRNGQEGGRLRSLRDLFRRNRPDAELQRQITFKTPEVQVEVLPVPDEGQPANYSGAVGDFFVHLGINDTAARQHESSIVTLQIRGTGNFPLITDPVISWPAGVDAPPPTVKEEVNKYEFPLSGIKSFQYTIHNNDTGTFVIPPVTFSFFDPAAKKYKTVSSEEVRYTVSDSGGKRSFSPKEIVGRTKDTPLHYYYFAIVGVVIAGVILFIMMKRER